MGGLHALVGSFGLIHFSLGISMIIDPSLWASGAEAPPWWFGWLLAVIGGAFVLFGWALGFVTILSGRYIARRKHRIFSIVIGAINCGMMPIGTVLGVFDIILLTKDETRAQYDAAGG